MDVTSDMNNFIFMGKLMESLLQMAFNFVTADVARPSLPLISSVELPSLVRVDPRKVKLATSHACLLSMIPVAAYCLVQLTRILFFSMLISIP